MPETTDSGDPTDLPSHVQDLSKLVVAYVKQETLEPLQNLKQFLKFGLPGSGLIAFGLVLLFLGVLRLLQDETGDAFRGHLSFLPYVITVALCGIVAGGAMKARGRKKEKNRT